MAEGISKKPVVSEKHWRVPELALEWNVSTDTIIRIFKGEPGVMKINGDAPPKSISAVNTKKPRANRVTLIIPDSVAVRVKLRLTGDQEGLRDDGLKAAAPSRNKLRVVTLRDIRARMSEQPRKIVHTDTA